MEGSLQYERSKLAYSQYIIRHLLFYFVWRAEIQKKKEPCMRRIRGKAAA